MSQDSAVDSEFPAGLLKWAGHHGGGVKRPFHAGSGRPTGEHVETPVIARLRAWADALLAAPAITPTAVLLVGGPGNGKTDAVEVLIEYLDKGLRAEGRLVDECSRIYAATDGRLAPRQASITLQQLSVELPPGLPQRLCIIQDASEDPQQAGNSRGKLLAMELLQCTRKPDDSIYICCANRGVVSEALLAAKNDIELEGVVAILEELLEAVTTGPKDVPCWPLPSAPRLAAWPMDVESLTADRKVSHSVCRDFLRVAVDRRRWPTNCPAGKKCPFCTNREILAGEEASASLSKLLRYFELASGKRWTFRDLFSLIPHIIVGDDREYAGKQGVSGPCAWAAEQIKKSSSGSADSMRSKLNLAAKLYHHRLFPLWPSFRKDLYSKAAKDLAGLKKPQLEAALGLMGWLGTRRHSNETDISRLLATTWSEVLDPALSSGALTLFETKKRAWTVQEIEEHFSLSISDGLDVVRRELQPVEAEILRDLSVSDDFLASQDYPRRCTPSAVIVLQVIRQFACRLVKRSLGTRRGVCRGSVRLGEYQDATINTDKLKGFRKSLQALMHDDRNRFTASLATTFGQPVPYRSRDVRLITSKVSVKSVQRTECDTRPIDPVPYVRIGNYVVPVTMELFSSLADRDGGLRAASLPPAVFALFDTTRSIVTGEAVRDPRTREDVVLIEIGGSRQCFHLEDGSFLVISQGESYAG
jgi:hypothetical protein